MGNKGCIGDKRPPINTEQDKISGDKGSVGNKGTIGAKGPLENKGFIGANRPSISTDEGNISGDKCSTGNNGRIGDNESSINTEQGEMKVILVLKDSSSK